jgi:TatA/E family protein of Tat protein translocase
MGLSNPLHIAILVVVLLLVFGHRRIPAMARALGSTKNEFKAGLRSGPSAAPPTSAVDVRAQTPAAHGSAGGVTVERES